MSRPQVFQAPSLAVPQTSCDEEQTSQNGAGQRRCVVGAAFTVSTSTIVFILIVGALVVFSELSGPSVLDRRARNVQAVQDAVNAVAVTARSRKMEVPLDETYVSFPIDVSTPRPVKWKLQLMEVKDAEPSGSQRFRLLKHSDGRVTLQDSHGFHVDVEGEVAMAVGAVLTNGTLAEAPIEESGAFTIMFNFDSTISLRQGDYSCLASNRTGSVHLATCDEKDGAGSAWNPIIFRAEGTVAFAAEDGRYLTVVEMWVQDYSMSVVMVDPKVAEKTASQCAKLYRAPGADGGTAFETLRASYLTLSEGAPLTANGVEAGSHQLFVETANVNDSISLSLASGDERAYLELQSNGTLAATAASSGPASSFSVKNNPGGTISLFSGPKVLCAAERTITVLTCETRRGGAETWPMQGVHNTLMIRNVCLNLQWYGFKTKVDAYARAMEDMAAQGQPSHLAVLVDNSDVAFGGCSYEELLSRYDRIRSATGATIIAGADNSPWPTGDWPYEDLKPTREKVMKAFGMRPDQYCNHTDCQTYSYEYANSGFLMGTPEDLLTLLGCMADNGFGDFGKTGYDDQQGLQVCMFSDRRGARVALDYPGTLSMQLIRFDNETLYEANGKVFNRGAGGMSQCFVHGNGDTLSFWWPKLFPGSQKTDDYGKGFIV